jgi:hypothetical protein
MRLNLRTAGLLVVIAGIGLTGCSSQTDAGSVSASIPSAGTTVSLSESLTHLHGAAVDDAGDLFAATHDGVWRVAGDGSVSRAGS